MSKEIDHCYYQEFKRTPEEERIVRDSRRIEDLERRVLTLEGKLEDLINGREIRVP